MLQVIHHILKKKTSYKITTSPKDRGGKKYLNMRRIKGDYY